MIPSPSIVAMTCGNKEDRISLEEIQPLLKTICDICFLKRENIFPFPKTFNICKLRQDTTELHIKYNLLSLNVFSISYNILQK